MSEPARDDLPHSENAQLLDYASPQKSPSRWKERLAICSVLVFIGAGTVLVLLPVFGRARTCCGGPPQCGANLHQIVNALIIYTQDNGGRFPDSFESAITANPSLAAPQSWAKMLICRGSEDTPASGTAPAEVAKNISSLGRPEQFLNAKSHPSLHLSYIYAGKGITMKSDPKTVLVYEPLDHHVVGNVPTMNVAYRDGSVRSYSGPAATKLFAELQAGRNPPMTQISE